MIDYKMVKSFSGSVDLVETFTTEPETKKLLQIETNRVYFDKVVDVIIGYSGEGEDKTPIAKYTYQEIDKTEEDLNRDKELKELREKRGGNR